LGLKESRKIVKIGIQKGLSERRACELMDLNRSSVRYFPQGLSQFTQRIEKQTIALAKKHQAYGYKMITKLLKRLGYPTGKTRILSIWQRQGLAQPVRKKRKRTKFPFVRPLPATKVNEVWCYDFLFVQTEHKETLKILVVLDEYSRECLGLYVDRKINSEGVKMVLEAIVKERGAPQYMRSDNGPEFISKNLRKWLSQHGIRPQYIEPGSPWQNAFVESFNGTLRRECLNREMFWSRAETQAICDWYKQLYNVNRVPTPHFPSG